MLITDAPARIASRMPLADSLQEIVSSSGTFSVRAPGQTPDRPTPLAEAEATEAVAVPCGLTTGSPGKAWVWPASWGWLTSAAESTRALRGLVAVTAGGLSPGPTMWLRHGIRTPSGS